MPRNPHDFDLDPGRYQRGDREEDDGPGGFGDPDDADIEPDRSVARHAEAEDAEEAEIAEEDILEITDLEDELDARKGDDSSDE